MQDGLGPPPKEIGVGLEALTHHAHVRRLAVADGDDEVLPEEDVDLTELDPLHVVEVAGGLEHHEQRPAVALHLGPLVGVQRVLHRQRVKLELLSNGLELLRRRLVEPDPGDTLLMRHAS